MTHKHSEPLTFNPFSGLSHPGVTLGRDGQPQTGFQTPPELQLQEVQPDTSQTPQNSHESGDKNYAGNQPPLSKEDMHMNQGHAQKTETDTGTMKDKVEKHKARAKEAEENAAKFLAMAKEMEARAKKAEKEADLANSDNAEVRKMRSFQESQAAAQARSAEQTANFALAAKETLTGIEGKIASADKRLAKLTKQAERTADAAETAAETYNRRDTATILVGMGIGGVFGGAVAFGIGELAVPEAPLGAKVGMVGIGVVVGGGFGAALGAAANGPETGKKKGKKGKGKKKSKKDKN